jgi:putative ABC transport system permease protein
MKRILAQTYLSEIQASAITEDVTEKATEEMTQILRRNHKLKSATDEAEADADDSTYVHRRNYPQC